MTNLILNNNENDTEKQMKSNKNIEDVFKLLNEVFTNYKPNEVFLSFNGGKDCTVLLDLVKSYLNSKDELKNVQIRVIYIQPNNPFDEVEDFIDECEIIYNLKIEKRSGKLKPILEAICEENKNLKSVIMGCRRTDPYCQNLESMQPTDRTWPPLMRINPLLDWTCQDIWYYILNKKIPYCILYNEGYTSLGDKTNTKKNPNLQRIDPVTGETNYAPAYELLDDNLERAGRN